MPPSARHAGKGDVILADFADHGEFGPVDVAAEGKIPGQINVFGLGSPFIRSGMLGGAVPDTLDQVHPPRIRPVEKITQVCRTGPVLSGPSSADKSERGLGVVLADPSSGGTDIRY